METRGNYVGHSLRNPSPCGFSHAEPRAQLTLGLGPARGIGPGPCVRHRSLTPSIVRLRVVSFLRCASRHASLESKQRIVVTPW